MKGKKYQCSLKYTALNNLGEKRFLEIDSKHTIRNANRNLYSIFTALLFIIVKNQN